MSKNTLLNYFTRTPVSTSKRKDANDDAEEESKVSKTPKSSKKIDAKTPKQNGTVKAKTPSQKTPTQNGINAKTPKRSRTSLEQFSSPVSNVEKSAKKLPRVHHHSIYSSSITLKLILLL
jgi:hypothetical protein